MSVSPPIPPSPRPRKRLHDSLAGMDDDQEFDETATKRVKDRDFDDTLEGELPGDHSYGAHEVRPAWRKGLYVQLWTDNFNANGKKIVCNLCQGPIQLTSKSPAGLEVYPPTQHYKEQTRPHIDHYNPDWVVRHATVNQIILHANPALTPAQQKKLLDWAMNSVPLRIVHRRCNLTRPRAQGVAHGGFRAAMLSAKAQWGT